MSLLKQLITGFANEAYVPMPKVYGGCYGCREARMLAAMREGLLNDYYWLGHAPKLGPSYVDGKHVLDVSCDDCGSRIKAHVVILPDGPNLWVDSVTMVYGCKRPVEVKAGT